MSSIPLVALLIVSAMWGSHPVIGKIVEHQMGPLSLTFWRFTLGALCYAPFYRRFKGIFRLPRRTLLQLGFAALSWAVLYPLLYYRSLHDLTPVESLLLVNTSPFLAALFGWLALHERLHKLEWIGIAISFSGVVVLLLDQWTGTFAISGVVLALLAAAAFASYTVSSRSLFQTLPLLDVLLATSVGGALFLWIVSGVTGQLPTVFHDALNLTRAGWWELLYIVLVVSTFAYVLYGYGLRKTPAGIASAITFYPQAIFAALIQWVWLGLVPAAMIWLSAIMILGGTALMQRARRKVKPV